MVLRAGPRASPPTPVMAVPDKALGDDPRHEFVGIVDALAPAESQRERDGVDAVRAPAHSSGCGALFRLCEMFCVETDDIAMPRTLGIRARNRTRKSPFENAVPPSCVRQN